MAKRGLNLPQTDGASVGRNGRVDWLIRLDRVDPRHDRAVESLFALSNGYVGTGAALPIRSSSSEPETILAGLFEVDESSGESALMHWPDWLSIRLTIAGRPVAATPDELVWHRRSLDMRRGQVTYELRHQDPAGRTTHVRILECASMADRHLLLERVEVTPENYTGECEAELLLDARLPDAPVTRVPLTVGPHTLALRISGSAGTVAVTASTFASWPAAPVEPVRNAHDGWVGQRWAWEGHLGTTYRLDKLVSIATSRDADDPVGFSSDHRQHIRGTGLAGALAAHAREWSRKWRLADSELDGDSEAQRALRFAAYHLISAANPEDERVSIGARGLTGEAYKGHVFWDTEIFMLPFFVLTDPAAARSLLMYRFHTLPAAREKAHDLRYRGALYAWESGKNGREAAPSEVIGPSGQPVPVLTGAQEHHISADVAYAVWQYWRATRDQAFFRTAGAEIVLETARFWASRASYEADGRSHVRRVIGPDEYHETVDDNAYTNCMAAWNLRRGLETAALLAERWPARWRALKAKLGLKQQEVVDWRRIADSMVTGLDPGSQLIEQFAGYHALEEIDLAAYEPRAAPMDVLLGHNRIQRTKIIKQADVLLLLYLLGDEFSPQAREVNLRYYEPRTGHGSSLSPGIHAVAAARIGDLDLAQRYFRQTAAIDLGDGMGNTAWGVHLGAMGSLWQAAVMGFAGVELSDNALALQPRLPAGWRELCFRLQWRGRALCIQIERDPPRCRVELESGPPLSVRVDGEDVSSLGHGSGRSMDGLDRRCELREEPQDD